MPSDAASGYRRYRAPRTDNSVVAIPALDEVSVRVDPSLHELQLGDWQLGALRLAAREQLLAAAADYTSTYLPLDQPLDPTAPLLLTGHQAELFHPGVWFKNFALSRLAQRHRGVGIHLVVDSDTVHNSSIRVPTDSVAAPRVESVPLDASTTPLPVEERRIADRQVFDSFGTRATEALRPLLSNPLVADWWPSVVKAVERTGGNGHLAIAQARHQLERDWGAVTLELPMSHACQLPVFGSFAAALLLDAPRVWQAYNDALAAYRHAHALRSDAQPMPDLARHDDWLEMPFWVWSVDQPQRRPLYVRTVGDQLQLTNQRGWQASLSTKPTLASEQLRELAAEGLKLRTRALTTTLYSRLVLGDVFLHGIGGAKYDEVTDDWAHRLWGIRLPQYVALSATLQLPIEHRSVDNTDLRRVERDLRDWQWHPERWASETSSPEATLALADKQRWVETPKTPLNASERHQAIAAANEKLQQETAAVRQRLEQEQQQLEAHYRASQVLESREYSFCLFPAEDLRQRMWNLLDA